MDHPLTAEQQKDTERLQRYITREQLQSVLNATKWREAVAALRAIPDFTVRFRVKTVREAPPDPAFWEGSVPWHLPPPVTIEWLEVDPIQRIRRGILVPDIEIDRSVVIMQALHSIQVPFSREGNAIRIWGYLRSGTVPEL